MLDGKISQGVKMKKFSAILISILIGVIIPKVSFAELYDSVNSIVNKIEEERFKGSVVYVHIHGKNPDVDAAEDLIPAGGNYVGFPGGSGELFEVFSSDAADASAGTGVQTIRVFYCDDDKVCFDSSGNFLSFDITMNGVTGVDSLVSGRRVWHVECLTTGSGTVNAGTITVRNKTTTANIFSVMQIGKCVSQEAVFTIPSGYKGYLEKLTASMTDTSANRAVLAFTEQLDNGTVKTDEELTVGTGFSNHPPRYGGFMFASKSDIKIRALEVTNANGVIHASYRVRLVKQP